MPKRHEMGDVAEFSCECGKDVFCVTIGKSQGWGEIREMTRACTDPITGVVDFVDGLAVCKPDGSVLWLDYPADPFRPFQAHEHPEEGFHGEDGG